MPPKSTNVSRSPEWLLLVYQLPAKPSNIRVRTWRRLQQVGAVGLKNSAYVLPNTPQCKEDFEWIRGEIAAMNGEANIFLADHGDAVTQGKIAAAFRKARQAEFVVICREAKTLLRAVERRPSATPALRKLERSTRLLRDRLSAVLTIDFFHAPGRDESLALLEKTEALLRRGPAATKFIPGTGEKLMPEKFHSRTWVTRPRPGVDRMSSAWLIRRFIDADAKFTFAEKSADVPNAVAFDMFDGQFSHQGNHCSFETLLHRFALEGSALARIGQIVHNLDLKDERFEVSEAAAVDRLVEGLRQIYSDDQKLLEHGMEIFEALYRSLTNTPPGKQRRKGAVSYTGLS